MNAKNIIVITDTIHTVRKIFDSSFHLYQLHSIAISQDLKAFFNKSSNNSIAFWDCLSSANWHSHLAVNKETKQFNIDPIFSYKSWDFSKKEECDSILQNWQMTFQALNYKGNNFLDLTNGNSYHTKPTYTKNSTWLKHFEHSNTLCVYYKMNYLLVCDIWTLSVLSEV